MPFPQEVKDQCLSRAGRRCQCTRSGHGHTGRCNTTLYAGGWEAHHITAESKGGPDTLANCEALCIPCHQKTASFGG